MSTGSYIAFTGADASMQALEIVANNVANANTAGFKRDTTLFDTVLGGEMAFVQVENGKVDLSPGALRQTGNVLHAALQGSAFFVVQAEDGSERLTRRGDFRLDTTGRLVLPGGQPVLGTSGPLSVPLDADARLLGDGRLVTADGEVGRLRVVTVDDPSALIKLGGNLLTPAEGVPVQDVSEPSVVVGSIEQSNVRLAQEMVAMIQAARSFEAAMQAMRIEDETSQRLIEAQ